MTSTSGLRDKRPAGKHHIHSNRCTSRERWSQGELCFLCWRQQRRDQFVQQWKCFRATIYCLRQHTLLKYHSEPMFVIFAPLSGHVFKIPTSQVWFQYREYSNLMLRLVLTMYCGYLQGAKLVRSPIAAVAPFISIDGLSCKLLLMR